MKSPLDRLNLKPQERRLVVIVSIVVFIAVNVWLVWPHFGDLGLWQQRKKDTRSTMDRYRQEIGRKNLYTREREKLKLLGSVVPKSDTQVELQKEIEGKARQAGVTVTSWSPERRGNVAGKTNEFFEEESLQIRVNTGETNLVDFLYSIGSGDSLIRVRNLSLQPDGSRMRLAGDITLVESFQKRPAARTIPAAKPVVPAAGVAAKPAPAPAVAAMPAAATDTAPKNFSVPPPRRTAPPVNAMGAGTRPAPVRPVPINPTNASSRVTIPKRPVPTLPAPK